MFAKKNITLLQFKYTLILGNPSPGYPNGSQQIPAPTHVSEKRSFKYDMNNDNGKSQHGYTFDSI